MGELMFKRLLVLVNSALWNRKIDESLFIGMDDKMWDDLYSFSIRHGVMAIAFDGVRNLPYHIQPPLKLRMTWALGTERIEHKYKHMQDVVIDLMGIFRKEGISMLVFKGLNLSANYPIPAHREFGDIDIYLFGKHKIGDSLMSEAGAEKKETHHYKHSNYYYRDIMIENHAYFLNVRDSNKISRLNQILLDMLVEENKVESKQENGMLFPSSDFTALFFIVHAIKHLSSEPLPLRTYCDWALFLQKHATEVNIDKWKSALRDAGLLYIAEAMTTLTFRWLDAPHPASLNSVSHIEWEDYIGKEMTQPFYPPCKSKTPLKILIYKYKLFHIKYKRGVSIYGRNPFTYYISYFSRSLVLHIRDTKRIFNIQ